MTVTAEQGAAALDERVAAIEARLAIMDRLYAVAHAVDYGDEDGFIDCFTPDAVFSVHIGGQSEPTHRYVGHAGLRARIENHTRPPELYHKHLYLNPRITIEGDAARVDCYYLVIAEYESAPETLAFGRNRDVMVREPDGHWRIMERRSEMEVKSAVPVWTVRSTTPGAAGVA
jgi:3-phenylpropionate/cinnamic acid dioxygenase small subunit